jgi:hypothetical protein
MFNELSYIMKNCSKDEAGNAIDGFFSIFTNEENFCTIFRRIGLSVIILVSSHTRSCFSIFVFCKHEISPLTRFFIFRDVGQMLSRFSPCKSGDNQCC